MNALWVTRDRSEQQPDRYVFWLDKPTQFVDAGEIRFGQAAMAFMVTADVIHAASNFELPRGALALIELTVSPVDERDLKLALVRALATSAINSWEAPRQQLAAAVLDIIGRDEA